MILFSRGNLVYKDYIWTIYSNQDPRISGKPDQTGFNPHEGHQVVYLINKLMALWDYRFVNTGNKIERLIHNELPENIISQLDAQTWIREHLKF